MKSLRHFYLQKVKKEKICGVYKITSPSNRVYIGESSDIYKRWKNYKEFRCKSQRRLYSSLLKHGVENHIFEIIEECTVGDLNCRERYWQDFYDVLGKNGLNCKLTNCGDKKGEHSQETKDKIGNANRGENSSFYGKSPWNKGLKLPPLSEERKKSLSELHKNRVVSNETRKKLSEANTGKKRSKDTIEKWKESRKGYKTSPETKQKLSEANKGKKHTQETKEKLSLAKKGVPFSQKHKDSMKIAVNKLSKDGVLLKTYNSFDEASADSGVSKAHINDCCNIRRKSAGDFNWEYLEEQELNSVFLSVNKAKGYY